MTSLTLLFGRKVLSSKTVLPLCVSVFGIAAGMSAEARTVADLVITDGKIYTVDQRNPWVEAVAIKDGKYIAVGSEKVIKKYIGKSTEVVDLNGQMAMPGINDAHAHPMWGGVAELYSCNFSFTASPEEVASKIKSCADETPGEEWIRGGQWSSDFFEVNNIKSPRKFLDAVSGGHPVMLNDDSLHNGWMNSKGLKLAGIDANTKDPSGGKVVREPGSQEPNGILLESASVMAQAVVPKLTREQYVDAAKYVFHKLNSLGVTGVKDALAADEDLQAYKDLDDEGGLTLHVAAAIYGSFGGREIPLDVPSLVEKRERYKSPGVNDNFVKIGLDGVPTPARTALMLDPYLPDKEHGDHYRGKSHVTESLLTRDLIALDKAGFGVKIHTAGDGSVQMALDAVENTRKANGDSGIHYEFAHAGYVGDEDMDRFRELDVYPDFCPYLWYPSSIIDAIYLAVDNERAEHYFPTKSFLEKGVFVITGTDWPAAVPSPDPWKGIEGLVTRKDPYGKREGVLWPEQAVDLATAIQLFTLNSAAAFDLTDETGSVSVGKWADLIVLNQNIFEVPIEDVSETRVQKTFFEGNMVFTTTP